MSSKIQMVRKEKPSSSAAEAAPSGAEQAKKVQEGVRGASGPVDEQAPTGPSANYDPGPKGAKGEPGLPGIPVEEKFGNENYPLGEAKQPGPTGPSGHDGISGEPVPSDPPKGQDMPRDLGDGFWHIKPTPIEDVPADDQPNFYPGSQMSRRVAIARGIFATEIQGVGVIIEGAFLPGYKLVDIMDLDHKVVVERAVRRISG